jgi:hypothetical protein
LVRGQRKMSKALGMFGLLAFTMLWPVLLGARFETYEPFISLIFQFFLDCGKPRILNPRIQVRLYVCVYIYILNVLLLFYFIF